MKQLHLLLVATFSLGLSFPSGAFASDDAGVAYKVSPVVQNGMLD
jgi:hypothetical protein